MVGVKFADAWKIPQAHRFRYFSKSLSIRNCFVGRIRPRGRNPPNGLGPVLSQVEGAAGYAEPVPSPSTMLRTGLSKGQSRAETRG
jgi:hypothetical protein